MLSRLGPGPVFVYEWLLSSRRWRTYGQRVLFVGAIWAWLLLFGFAASMEDANDTVSIQQMARIGQSMYSAVIVIELTLLLIVAPAATAGAICLDKTRGTLEHMLVTDLSSAEIVLGKLAARLAPILGLVAAVLPVTALAGLFGGIDPLALGGSFLVALGCAVLTCTLALLLSVWGRKPHEVLMFSYLLIVLWMIAPGLLLFFQGMVGGPWHPLSAKLSNPYYLVFAPYTSPGSVDWTTYLGFLGGCLVVSAFLAGWATLRVRAVAARQSGAGPGVGARPHRRRRGFPLGELVQRLNPIRHLPGPSLDGNPVLWREWHRARPSWMLRVVWLMYSALGLFWVMLTIYNLATVPRRNHDETVVLVACFMNTFQVGLGLLLLGVSASTSLSEERARGSLEVLMSTPLSTRSILAGKWWGAFRQAAPVLIWPAALGGVLVAADVRRVFGCLALLALISAYAAAVVSLGLLQAVLERRPSRAAARCVAIGVGSTFGWFILLAIIGGMAPGHGPIWKSGFLVLSMASPVAGLPLTGLMMMVGQGEVMISGGFAAVMTGALLWTLGHWALAAMFFSDTVNSADARLGRMPEKTELPPELLGRRPRPESAMPAQSARE